MDKQYDAHANTYYNNGKNMDDGIAPMYSEGDPMVDAIREHEEFQKSVVEEMSIIDQNYVEAEAKGELNKEFIFADDYEAEM